MIYWGKANIFSLFIFQLLFSFFCWYLKLKYANLKNLPELSDAPGIAWIAAGLASGIWRGIFWHNDLPVRLSLSPLATTKTSIGLPGFRWRMRRSNARWPRCTWWGSRGAVHILFGALLINRRRQPKNDSLSSRARQILILFMKSEKFFQKMSENQLTQTIEGTFSIAVISHFFKILASLIIK